MGLYCEGLAVMTTNKEKIISDWHLDKRLSVANIMAITAIAIAVFTGWNDLTGIVEAQAVQLNTVSDRQDRQRSSVHENKDAIQELTTDTAVIKNTQEQMQRIQEENREDIKEILRAVKSK